MNNSSLKTKYNEIRTRSIASNSTESRFNIVKKTVNTTDEMMIDKKDRIEKYLILLNKKNNRFDRPTTATQNNKTLFTIRCLWK